MGKFSSFHLSFFYRYFFTKLAHVAFSEIALRSKSGWESGIDAVGRKNVFYRFFPSNFEPTKTFSYQGKIRQSPGYCRMEAFEGQWKGWMT